MSDVNEKRVARGARKPRALAAALAVAIATALAFPARADPPLAIGGAGGDLLLLVGTASNPAVDLVRALRASDGVPVALAGTAPTQCAAAKAVAMHPNGRFVYVVADTQPAGSVCAYEIDPVTRALLPAPGSPYPAGRGTRAIAVDPGGGFVYATNFTDGSITGYSVNDETGALSVHNASPYVSTDQGTGHLAIDPLGRFLYATNTDANGSVSGFAINRDNGQLTHVPFSPLRTPPLPGAVAVDPRGRFAYVAADPNQVYAIDAQTGRLVSANATFAPQARAMAFDPAGRYLFTVSGSGAQSLLNAYRVDGSGVPAWVGSVPTGADPASVAVARNGRHVYTANAGGGNVSGFRIDAATGALTPISV
jgi:6-phosphogluconolactonase (cycloisomerase 2 family)